MRNVRDIIENMTVSFTMVIISLKAFVLWRKLGDINKCGEISEILEVKARADPAHYDLLQSFKKTSAKIVKCFFIAYSGCLCLAVFSMFTYDTRRLLFPGYFPMDWENSRTIYIVCVLYQCLCWFMVGYANVFYDTYPGLLMYLLVQHLRITNLRTSRIGYDDSSLHENRVALKQASKDHQMILVLFKIINKAIIWTMFALFLVSSLNIVVCVVIMCFYSENFLQKLYYVQLMLCYCLETILGCYYGSEFEDEIGRTTNSLYMCLWYEQSPAFKKDFIIFMENSLKYYQFSAGGFVPVNKQTFLRVLKSTFSLYTVLNAMREKF